MGELHHTHTHIHQLLNVQFVPWKAPTVLPSTRGKNDLRLGSYQIWKIASINNVDHFTCRKFPRARKISIFSAYEIWNPCSDRLFWDFCCTRKKIDEVLNLIMSLRRGSSKPLISPIPTPLSQHYSIIFAFEISNKRELLLVLIPEVVQLQALVLVLSPVLI